MYKKIYDEKNNLIGIEAGSKIIPICEENYDYKKYLKDMDDGAEVIDEPYTEDEIAMFEKKSLISDEVLSVHGEFAKGFDFDGKHFGMKEHDQRNYESTCNGVIDGTITKGYVQIEPYGKFEVNSSNAKKFKKKYLEVKDAIIVAFEDKVSEIMK